MTVLIVLAVIFAIVGLVGSVVPGIPGPPISWLGLLLAYFYGVDISTGTLTFWFVVMLVVTIMDYIFPGMTTKYFGGHKAASTGAIIGLFAGMFIPVVGMIVGSILGAFLAELLIAGSDVWGSTKAAIGAFIGFILTTGVKLIVCGMMFYKTVVLLFF